MSEGAVSVPPREFPVLRAVKALALIRESRAGMVGLALIAFWVFVAIFAEVLAPYPPNQPMVPLQLPGTAAPDGGTFWLGTDKLGRDMLSRLIFGARQVLLYAPLATFCAYLVGIPMGLAAGYRRGLTDDVLSFIANVILSFPVLVLYIVIIAAVGASGTNIVLAVAFASAPGIMRIVRGLVLDLRNREYVLAAQTRGETPWRIMLAEILPNARGPLIVDACLRVGYVVIAIGTLGFLGLGLPPPDPDWGGMVSDNRELASFLPHVAIFPCIAISSLVLGFNLLADGLREVSLRD